MSRLKKKLLLYFILISVVSVSVSAEIILELSSPVFRNQVLKQFQIELSKDFSEEKTNAFMKETLDVESLFEVFNIFQMRMILLLSVVTASIVGAFFMFTREIVSPMEGMVAATKKIADGDLSTTVPVKSDDEIGQIGNLINDMSVNLQEMIIQIRQEVKRLREKISEANEKVTKSLHTKELTRAIEEKRIKLKDLRNIVSTGDELSTILDDMVVELSSLQAFINMYKVFQVADEKSEDLKVLASLQEEKSDTDGG
ncbi:MAG: HAMP domain-containing protein [Spirochaetia bacterium]|nr:HAMP domain-containing protein [Spirochaetia bacterium]